MIHTESSDKKYVIWIVFGALSLTLPRSSFPFQSLLFVRRKFALVFAHSHFPYFGSCSGLLGIFSCVEYRKFSYFLLLVYGASHFYVLLAWFFARLFPLSFPFSIHYHRNNFFFRPLLLRLFSHCHQFTTVFPWNFYLRIKCFFSGWSFTRWNDAGMSCKTGKLCLLFQISNHQSRPHIEFVSRLCWAEMNWIEPKHTVNQLFFGKETIKNYF